MQHDEVIWQVIRHNHCSFMAKIETGKFCRNPYNVTGICNRSSCPLANSRYATIRDHDDVLAQIFGTQNKATADQNDSDANSEKIMTTPRKEKKREARREEKAEKAAVLDKSIEKELLERLKKGVYGDIYNYPADKYNEILDKEQLAADDIEEDEEEAEIEFVEGYDDLEEEEDIEDFGGLAVNKSSLDDDDVGLDDNDDDETVAVEHKRVRRESSLALRKLGNDEGGTKPKKKARVLVEQIMFQILGSHVKHVFLPAPLYLWLNKKILMEDRRQSTESVRGVFASFRDCEQVHRQSQEFLLSLIDRVATCWRKFEICLKSEVSSQFATFLEEELEEQEDYED
ncbi:protein MAK16-like [Citrus sinensis]|nr:protein MAK16-like [Citrus sinensis]